MKIGQAGWVLGCGFLGFVAVGCGSSDSTPSTGPKMGAATPDCGTVQEPLELTLKNVEPALGSSLPNANIVQSFTIAGKQLKIELALARPASHTAGEPVPATITWSYGVSGSDTVYTSQPISWSKAGHVELDPAGLLETADHCVWVMSTPVFSYDVTP